MKMFLGDRTCIAEMQTNHRAIGPGDANVLKPTQTEIEYQRSQREKYSYALEQSGAIPSYV